MNWTDCLTALGVRADLVPKWALVFESNCRPEAFSLGLAEIDDFLGQIMLDSVALQVMGY